MLGTTHWRGPSGGPGDPFEWSEFGATAISDAETLRRVDTSPNHEQLAPDQVGNDQFWKRGVSSPGMWTGVDDWAPPFCANRFAPGVCSAAAFDDIETIVRLSQWTQAEAYRFAYQAARRRKWHRSLMASWTFDEPWPNSAQGCILDFYGLAKMAFYWVKQSLQMVDVSLSYSDVWQQAGRPLNAHVWVDNEHEYGFNFSHSIEYFTPDGALDVSEHTTTYESSASVGAADHVNLGQPEFIIPPQLVGNVLIARVSVFDTAGERLATNDYHFAIVNTSAHEAQKTQQSGPLRPLLVAPRVDLAIVKLGQLYAVSIKGNSTTSALYVKPMLLDTQGKQLPYVAFDSGYATLRPNSVTNFTVIEQGTSMEGCDVHGCKFCVEAWNAGRVCVEA